MPNIKKEQKNIKKEQKGTSKLETVEFCLNTDFVLFSKNFHKCGKVPPRKCLPAVSSDALTWSQKGLYGPYYWGEEATMSETEPWILANE